MQGMEENVKETVISILEEITEDAVPMKKKQDAIIQKQRRAHKTFFLKRYLKF